VSAQDAFEEEMGFLGRIRDEDAERLLAGYAPHGGSVQLDEVASFIDALRGAVPAWPDPRDESFMVRQLAATARSASAAATVETVPMAAVRRARRRPRIALLAKVAVPVALVPAVLAGLAFAGVRLPEPALDALDTVGVELPNQSDEDSATSIDDNGASEDAASRSGRGESGGDAASSGDSERANGHGRGDQGRGREHGQGEESVDSQGGGDGPAGVPPGQGGTPPGQGGTPPGQAAPPPGQGGTPPGQGGAIPGSGSGGQSAEPHGGAPDGDPAGQATPE
jgi:hypothetical protein